MTEGQQNKTRETKRWMAWMLALTMLLSPALSATVMAATPTLFGSNTTPDGNHTLGNTSISTLGITAIPNEGLDEFTMTLHSAVKINGNMQPGARIENNAFISQNDPFFIRINWELLEHVLADTEYDLEPFPGNIAAPINSSSSTFSIELEGGPQDFVTLSWERGNRALKVQFIDPGEIDGESILNLLEDVNIYFACNLASDGLDANEKGEINLKFPGTAAIKVNCTL